MTLGNGHHRSRPVPHETAGLRIVSPAPRQIWRQALAGDPTALPSQTPEWVDWLCATRGRTDASRLYQFPGGRQLVLPLVARTCGGLLLSEESMPYGFGYGGALVTGGRPTAGEIRAILGDLADRPAARASLVPNPLNAGPWEDNAPASAVRLPFLCQFVDLAGGFESVWSERYRSQTRSKLRKALKSGLDIRRYPDPAIVEAFAELNARSVERWAAQRGQPLWAARLVERCRDRVGQLTTASAALGDMCVVRSAHLHGRPVAVVASLHFGQQAVGWLAAMDRELANRTSGSTLLQSMAIEDACNKGARYFHMGESDPGSGVESSKAALGGTPLRYNALRFERLPLTNLDQRARAVLQRLTPATRRGLHP